ncbi:MAG TPA: diacylglycerol kinase family protein [Acidobacteriota bacterium]|nr:diacylglycerol kinase family protein [Acidobacteriota bacterium]
MKLTIIANPIAGRGRAYRSLQKYVLQWPHRDWEVDVLPTRGPNHAGQLARDLLAHPPDVLAVCGGDGTVNEIATAIPEPPFPVALLPAGTANVLARELRLPMNPVRALQVALTGKARRIDLGSLGPASGRRFLFVAGIGFDAFTVSLARPEVKSRLGIGAYVVAIAECLRKYSFPEFRVTSGNRTLTATSCLVCNSKKYGGGLLFCPEADMHDGLLDILVLEGRRRFALVVFLVLAWFQRPMKGQWIHRFRSDTLKIEGGEGLLVQVDGELAGGLPLDIGLKPSSFPLIVP